MSDVYAFKLKCEVTKDMFRGDSTVRMGYVISKNGNDGFHGMMPGMYWGEMDDKHVAMMTEIFAKMQAEMDAKTRDLANMNYEEMVAVQGAGVAMFAHLNAMGAEKAREKKEHKDD